MSGMHSTVAQLFEACPFVEAHTDPDCLDLPIVVFGDAARLLRERSVDEAQQDALLGFFNRLAETGSSDEIEILGTGAIETLNDDPRSQRLAKAKLSGRARQMLDEFRVYWGQPDYG